MKRIENRCADCATEGYPCDSLCILKKYPVLYCDVCGTETDELWIMDNAELCEDCLKEQFEKIH